MYMWEKGFAIVCAMPRWNISPLNYTETISGVKLNSIKLINLISLQREGITIKTSH